jgi:UDP-3-O-[3-hydroxymyristoyl] N-acetylglucosamine deacetylase/3-hydroxyacyl-[acyl-carrier-protein] dehydratase
MLDILGDLSLLGRPLQGHLIAVKPSHTSNCELVRRINAQMHRPLTFAPPPPAPKPEPKSEAKGAEKPLDIALEWNGVMNLLPHRYPFLMVDRILKIDGNQIVGLKNVTINEPFFQGHFPGHPIMPGVLQLEAMAQVAGILMLRHAENAGLIAYFMAAENVKWRKPVRPGDSVVIEVELTKMRGKIGRAKGVCKVQDDVVSEAEVTFVLREP